MKGLRFAMGKIYVMLNGIEFAISEEVLRLFSRRKLEELKVIPVFRVGKFSWDAVTFLNCDCWKIRKEFMESTNQRIYTLHFVSEDEFNRILKYF